MRKGIRNERKFNEFVETSDTMAPNVLAGVDMQSYTDLIRSGIDPWKYTYKVIGYCLRAYEGETLTYVYVAEARKWALACVNDGTLGVQCTSESVPKESTK
jgi:hypothetical protein